MDQVYIQVHDPTLSLRMPHVPDQPPPFGLPPVLLKLQLFLRELLGMFIWYKARIPWASLWSFTVSP